MSEEKKNSLLSRFNMNEVIPFLGLVLVVAVFQIVSHGKLLSASNLRSFSNYLFQIIVPACGYIFLMSQGNMDFSLAGMVDGSAVAYLVKNAMFNAVGGIAAYRLISLKNL